MIKLRYPAILVALILPLSATGCRFRPAALSPGRNSVENAAEMLPLTATCDGIGVADAATYTPDSSQPVAAVVHDNAAVTINNRYLDSSIKRAKSLEEAQLAVCIVLGKLHESDSCGYGERQLGDITVNAETIKRQGQEADVTLVEAKTGQPLAAESIFVESTCPESITYSEDSPPPEVFELEPQALQKKIAQWIPEAIADARPLTQDVVEKALGEYKRSDSKPPSVSFSEPAYFVSRTEADIAEVKAQCEALNESSKAAKKGIPLHISFSSYAEYNSIDAGDRESTINRRVQSTLKELKEEDLPAVGEVIAATQAIVPTHQELLGWQELLLRQLNKLDADLKQYQTLATQAETFVSKESVDRTQLDPVSQEMKAVADAIEQDAQNLEKTYDRIRNRCYDLD